MAFSAIPSIFKIWNRLRNTNNKTKNGKNLGNFSIFFKTTAFFKKEIIVFIEIKKQLLIENINIISLTYDT